MADRSGTGGATSNAASRAFQPGAVSSVFAEWWPLALGLVILTGLWAGPLARMARYAFSAHMMLHLGVTVVAAPLIAVGALRLGLTKARGRRPAGLAILASGVEMVVVWGWHAPAMHDAAAGHDPIFVLQQASFFAAGFAVWTVSFSGSDRIARGVGALAMLFTSMHMSMLGVLLVVAPHLIYSPLYCTGAWGLSPLDDQRLGGALMAMAGGLPYLVGAAALGWRLLQEAK